MITAQTLARPAARHTPDRFIGAAAAAEWRATGDPRHEAVGQAPSGAGFMALLEAFRATGGTVPGHIVARLLGEHRVGDAVSLARLVFTGEMFGFGWRGSLWVPMFQFDPGDLSVRPGPQQVRAELPQDWPGWALASWFAAPNAHLGGRRPTDSLESDLVGAVRAARAVETARR